MDKSSVIGELLYILFVNEKARMKTSKIWTKRYKNSLRNSLYVAQDLLLLLKTNSIIKLQQLVPLLKFFAEYKMINYKNSEVEEFLESFSQVELSEKVQYIESYTEIVYLIETLIKNDLILLGIKPNSYKIQLWCSFQALHNLVRVFLHPSQQTLFNINVQGVSIREAMQDVQNYISEITIYK